MSGGFLVVGEGAVVKANIKAKTVILIGTVHGNIEATSRLEIHGTGKLYGNIRTAKLQIADGVVFEGKCEMIKGDAKKAGQGIRGKRRAQRNRGRSSSRITNQDRPVMNGHEAACYDKTDDGTGTVQCRLCPHNCVIRKGKHGICGVRKNSDGTLITEIYGLLTAVAMDPIEKKPLYHFHPGASILSIGTSGCNMKCPYCQNWHISQDTRGPRQPSIHPSTSSTMRSAKAPSALPIPTPSRSSGSNTSWTPRSWRGKKSSST